MKKHSFNNADSAINDLCIYCTYHDCNSNEPSTRCRIKDIIECKDKRCHAPQLWNLDTRLLDQAIDSELIETLKILKITCEKYLNCSACPIKCHSKCIKKSLTRITCPGDWDTDIISL